MIAIITGTTIAATLRLLEPLIGSSDNVDFGVVEILQDALLPLIEPPSDKLLALALLFATVGTLREADSPNAHNTDVNVGHLRMILTLR